MNRYSLLLYVGGNFHNTDEEYAALLLPILSANVRKHLNLKDDASPKDLTEALQAKFSAEEITREFSRKKILANILPAADIGVLQELCRWRNEVNKRKWKNSMWIPFLRDVSNTNAQTNFVDACTCLLMNVCVRKPSSIR